jgi:hypothetical protein
LCWIPCVVCVELCAATVMSPFRPAGSLTWRGSWAEVVEQGCGDGSAVAVVTVGRRELGRPRARLVRLSVRIFHLRA